MVAITARTFSRGEVAPAIYPRVDLKQYAASLRTCENVEILRYGGAANRPGTRFNGLAKFPGKKTVLIPFQTDEKAGQIIELGDQYVRFYYENSLLSNGVTQTISAITNSVQALVTSHAHGFSDGDLLVVTDPGNLLILTGMTFTVANSTLDDFKIVDAFGNYIDSTSWGVYVGGATITKVKEYALPYKENEIADVKYAQSGSIITLVHHNYPPMELKYLNGEWTAGKMAFDPAIAFPFGLSGAPSAGTTNTYHYIVTAVDKITGEESLAGAFNNPEVVATISKNNPAVIELANSTNYRVGETILIGDNPASTDAPGMIEIENGRYQIVSTTATSISINLDTTSFGAYVADSLAIFSTEIEVKSNAPTVQAPITLSWSIVPEAGEYNIYRESDNSGVYGLIGIVGGLEYKDIGVDPDLTTTPPKQNRYFNVANDYPSVVAYAQQRLIFANTLADPERIFMSKPGYFTNFTTSSPIQADDAVVFRLAGSGMNAVRAVLDLNNVVILTSTSEWVLRGDAGGVVTPTTINAKQTSYNGSGLVQPVLVDDIAIYLQARGAILRDLRFSYEVDGFKGDDLTLFSNHLFDGFEIVDMAYQQVPQSILWVVRNDGVLLGLTYLRNQQIIAWHKHSFQDGKVESIAVAPNGDQDYLSLVINRNGARHIETMTSRFVTKENQGIFCDLAKQLDGSVTYGMATGITITSETGDWTYNDTIKAITNGDDFTLEIGDAFIYDNGFKLTITEITTSQDFKCSPNKGVPLELQGTTSNKFSIGFKTIRGLHHLDGKEVSVIGDKMVLSSPNNPDKPSWIVTNGRIELDYARSVITVGLPYISDIETLDIDTAQGETMADKQKLISRVTMFLEKTRGVFVGSNADDLLELKIRQYENYYEPVDLITTTEFINIKPEWNSNGRVLVRQYDPLPMTILSISSSGLIPFKGV